MKGGEHLEPIIDRKWILVLVYQHKRYCIGLATNVTDVIGQGHYESRTIFDRGDRLLC